MLRAIIGFLAQALVMPGSAAASVQQLQEQALSQAGVAVRLDPRLAVPGCPSGFAFQPLSPEAVRASCPETGWQMRLPLSLARAAAPRRGQAVRVEMEGQGYRATVDAIVESTNAREGTLMLRNPRSGTRFQGLLQPDGRISANIGSAR